MGHRHGLGAGVGGGMRGYVSMHGLVCRGVVVAGLNEPGRELPARDASTFLCTLSYSTEQRCQEGCFNVHGRARWVLATEHWGRELTDAEPMAAFIGAGTPCRACPTPNGRSLHPKAYLHQERVSTRSYRPAWPGTNACSATGTRARHRGL